MKYVEGALYILIGLVFFTLRSVSKIDMMGLYESFRTDIVTFNTMLENGEISVVSHSITPYLLGLLFIILGVIKIREVMKNE